MYISGMASYRHLKTVRTHLASLVLSWSGDDTIPENVDQGLTEEVWRNIKSKGLVSETYLNLSDIKFGKINLKV